MLVQTPDQHVLHSWVNGVTCKLNELLKQQSQNECDYSLILFFLNNFVFIFCFYREKREQELEFFIQKKYNRLGKKFHARIATLDKLKTNPNLILK